MIFVINSMYPLTKHFSLELTIIKGMSSYKLCNQGQPSGETGIAAALASRKVC